MERRPYHGKRQECRFPDGPSRRALYRLPATNALKSLSQDAPTAFTE